MTADLFRLCLINDGTAETGLRPVVGRMPDVFVMEAHRVYLVSSPLPYWAADYLKQQIGRLFQVQSPRVLHTSSWSGSLPRWLRFLCFRRKFGPFDYRRLVQKEIKVVSREIGISCTVQEPWRLGYGITEEDFTFSGTAPHRANVDGWEEIHPAVDRLVRWFDGRRLREEELFRFVWRRGGRGGKFLVGVLEYGCLTGKIVRRPGIMYCGHGLWQCTRCGEMRDIELSPDMCPVCGRTKCPVCRACAGMGIVRGCEPVYEFTKNVQQELLAVPVLMHRDGARGQGRDRIEPILSFSLAESQAKASQQLVKFLASDKRHCLLWAVCGAGKTETVFHAMAEVLAAGQRVLFTIPRRDVVLELAPRLQRAFPTRKVTVLVGGQRDTEEMGEIVAATTHQTLRLAGVFGLVILDEADAFPYASDPVLMRAVQRCLAPFGKQVIMTATPDAEHLLNVKRGIWDLVVIPIRHHGHLLPVPQVLVHPSWRSPTGRHVKLALPARSDQKANDSDSGGIVGEASEDLFPLMIFVPTIAHGRFLYRYLRKLWPKTRVEFVYAAHPHRDQLVDAFRNGQIPVLVCTSILARGVTIPRVNVWVAWADVEQVLDAASLVQMAGRVGRTADYPTGEVWFLAGRKTGSIRQAVDIIRQANVWAQGGV